jgi:hypothetical protein
MTFEEAKARVAQAAEGSSGDNLVGMQIDFEHYLASSDLFVDIDVRTDPESAGILHASGKLLDPDLPVARLEGALIAIWQQYLRYRYFEAHEVTSTETATTLRFITQIEPAGFYVTGSIVMARTRPAPAA